MPLPSRVPLTWANGSGVHSAEGYPDLPQTADPQYVLIHLTFGTQVHEHSAVSSASPGLCLYVSKKVYPLFSFSFNTIAYRMFPSIHKGQITPLQCSIYFIYFIWHISSSGNPQIPFQISMTYQITNKEKAMNCAGQGHCNAKATTTPYDAFVQTGKRRSLWADVASGQDTP